MNLLKRREQAYERVRIQSFFSTVLNLDISTSDFEKNDLETSHLRLNQKLLRNFGGKWGNSTWFLIFVFMN